MFKKTLALVLTVLMLLPLLPVTGAAADPVTLTDNNGVAWVLGTGSIWYFRDKKGGSQTGTYAYTSVYGSTPTYAFDLANDCYYVYQSISWVKHPITKTLVDTNDITWYYNATKGWAYCYEDTKGVDMLGFIGSGYVVWDYLSRTGKTMPTKAYDEQNRQHIYEDGEWVYYPASLGDTINPTQHTILDNNGISWKYVSTGVDKGWKFFKNLNLYSYNQYTTITKKALPTTGTVTVDGYTIQFTFSQGIWYHGLNSGIEDNFDAMGDCLAVILDENLVYWGYYATSGWLFFYSSSTEALLPARPALYTSKTGKDLPTTGWLESDPSQIYYFNGTSWSNIYQGGIPGSGVISSLVLTDANGIHWIQDTDGIWCFYRTDPKSNYPYNFYVSQIGKAIPQTATAAYANRLYTFKWDGTKWALSEGTLPGSGSGTTDEDALIGYIISDENGIEWEFDSEKGWRFIYSEGGTVESYSARYYVQKTGKSLPEEGEALVSNGNSNIECRYSNGKWLPVVSTPSTPGIPGVSIPLALVDNNAISWTHSSTSGWTFYYGGQYYPASSYVSVTGKKLPIAGQVSYNGVTYTYFYQNGAWLNAPSGGGTTEEPDDPAEDAIILMDSNSVMWYYIDGWGFSYNNRFYPAAEYETVTHMSLPQFGYCTINGESVFCLFHNGSWVPMTGSLPSNPSNPSTPVIPQNVTALRGCTNPNGEDAVYDEKGYIWVKQSFSGDVVWASSDSNKYSEDTYPRYIDSLNRYWELHSTGWVYNPYITPTTSTATDPNKLSNLKDTKGYEWFKYSTTWYCAKLPEYTANKEIPTYKAPDNTIWYFVDNEWTKTAPVDNSPNAKTSLTDTKGYNWYKTSDGWISVNEAYYTENKLVPLYRDADKKLWKLVNDVWVEADGTEPTEPAKPATTPVHEVFKDVSKNLWCVDYIQYVYDNELYKGVSDDEFDPDGSMNRAMFVLVLARLAKVDLTKYKSVDFDDVSIDQWFGPAVAWASENGIVNGRGWIEGVGDNCFDPAGKVSRQDACTILIRFAEEYEKRDLDLRYTGTTYTDGTSIADYAKMAVSYCQQLGFLSGNIVVNNRFYPADPATRAEVATIIARYAEKFGK